MYCYHCGAKLVSEARFCHQCGKSLDIPEEKLDDKTIQAIKECILSGEEEIAPEVIEEMMKPVQRVEGPEIVLNILGHCRFLTMYLKQYYRNERFMIRTEVGE